MSETVCVLFWDGQYPNSGHRVEDVCSTYAAAEAQIPDGYDLQDSDSVYTRGDCIRSTMFSKSFEGSRHTEDYIIQEWEVSSYD